MTEENLNFKPPSRTSWQKGDRYQLAVRALEGGDVELIPWQESRRFPEWSPDGKQLAFVARNSIATMNADGSGLRTVASVGRAFVDLEWSPDGAALAVSRSANCGSRQRPGDVSLRIVPIGGGAIRSLPARPAGTPPLRTNSAQVFGLRWSPRGDRLLYQWQQYQEGECDRAGQWLSSRLLTIATDGRGRRQIAKIDGIWRSAWSPDGAFIVLAAGCEIYTVCNIATVSPAGARA